MAVENERKRLFIFQMLPGNQSLLADVYQSLAARLALVGEKDHALRGGYYQGITIWSERARKYPEDVRLRQGMAGIFAELSKLYLVF